MKKILLLIIAYWVFVPLKAQVYQPYTENEKDNAITILYKLNPSSTKKISLKKQKLTKFPKELLKFKNLEELDLSGNMFVKLPEEVGQLTSLKVLKLSVNNLKELPEALQNLENLVYLDISQNQLDKFPPVITKLKKLETLHIGSNNITNIPEDIGNLTNLRTLYCPYNKITKLPKNLSKLNNLTNLQANDNSIKSIPKELEQMQTLMNLMLYNNQLSSLPTELGKIKTLGNLDVSKNNFKTVPKELDHLFSLKTLYVMHKDGQIPFIPDELLRHIRDNQIKTDIGDIDLQRMMQDLASREEAQKQIAAAENEKNRLLVEEAKRAQELAEARAKNEENERKLTEERARADRERSALIQAETESQRLKAEKEREKAQLESELAQEKSAKEQERAIKEREAATKDRAAATKEKEAANEIKRQQEKAREATEKLNQTIIMAALGTLLFAFIFILYVLNSNRKVKQKQREAELQRAKADKLLLNILPVQVAEELKDKGVTEVRHFDNASILFADVKGFSSMASKVTPQELIKELDTTFGKFDDVIMQYGLERIKTIGDCYMCVGGVPNPDPANIVYMIAASLEIQNWMADEYTKRNGNFWQVRLGVHVGDLVAGVIGKTKFAYDVWGHAVNTASRMESGGEVSRVNISADTYHRVKDFFNCVYRGQIEAKNIGLVDTYFVESIKSELSMNNEGRLPNEEFKRKARALAG